MKFAVASLRGVPGVGGAPPATTAGAAPPVLAPGPDPAAEARSRVEAAAMVPALGAAVGCSDAEAAVLRALADRAATAPATVASGKSTGWLW